MHQTQRILDTDRFGPVEKRIDKPYSRKRIPHLHTKRRLSVSLESFKKDIGVFDPDLPRQYTSSQINGVMRLIFKKAAERIIKKMWRMPFPNGAGSVYMKEAQISSPGQSTGGKITTDGQIELLLREVQLGMKRVFLRWNKTGKKFPYRNIWKITMSKGFFRSMKFKEIIDCAEDPERKYRAHII